MQKPLIKSENKEITQFENQIHDIGVQLSLIKSLANFLYFGLSSDNVIEQSDNSNLASVLSDMIDDVYNKFNKFETEVNI